MNALKLLMLSLVFRLFFCLETPSQAQILCGGTGMQIPLIAGQHTPAGIVMTGNDEKYLFLFIKTDPGWVLTETHVDVEKSLNDFPMTKSGNPKIGNFAYKTTHDGVTTHVYAIPLQDIETRPGEVVFIAAHAVVAQIGYQGEIYRCETAWGQGSSFPGKNWATFFAFTLHPCIS